MGTSGSFGGSGGRDAADLRDSIAEWLDGFDSPAPDGDAPPAEIPGQAADQPDAANRPTIPVGIDLGSALRVLLRSGRGGGADGPGGGGGGSAGGGGRSSGGANRSVGRIAGATGKAGRLALAYTTGDRAALDQAGLNYDELRALADPVSIGIKIVEGSPPGGYATARSRTRP